MNFKTIEDLKKAGFTGFVKIAELWKDSSLIPDEKGIYMVVRKTTEAPVFLKKGTGGYFKGKEPNVSIEALKENWVAGTCVMYIGKAGSVSGSTTLHKRLGQYLRFGQGESIGHYGGRYIWQVKDAENLLFCWKPLKGLEEDPRMEEKSLISEFKNQYGGKRPFANLQD